MIPMLQKSFFPINKLTSENLRDCTRSIFPVTISIRTLREKIKFLEAHGKSIRSLKTLRGVCDGHASELLLLNFANPHDLKKIFGACLSLK